MADGDHKLELSPELAERLKAAADAAGLSVEVFAASLISQGLDDGLAEGGARYVSAGMDWFDDPDPEIDRRIAAETLSRGDGVPWETVRVCFAEFGKQVDSDGHVYVAADSGDERNEGLAESSARYAEYQRTGEYIDAGEAMVALRKTVIQRIRAKKA